jgi:single-strand DNA-binding protein
MGHLTHDVEVKTGSNTVYARFTIAVNEGAGDKKKAHFFKCVAFGKTADWMEGKYQKGALVHAAGRLTQNSWTDEKTGEKKSEISVIADRVSLLSQPKAAEGQETPGVPSSENWEEVPF